LFQHAIEDKKLPKRPVFQRVQHLFDRALQLVSRRRVWLTRIRSGSTENRHCHKLASLILRSSIAADPGLSRQLQMRRHEHRLSAIKKQQRVLTRQLNGLEKEALTIQAKWQELNPAPAAVAAAAGDSDTHLPADIVQRIRQAAALDVLDSLDVLWTEDDLKIRLLFGLPVSRNLWEFSMEKAGGSTDIPETLESE
jgi:hypothetical protein